MKGYRSEMLKVWGEHWYILNAAKNGPCICVLDAIQSGLHVCVLDVIQSGSHVLVLDVIQSGLHVCVLDAIQSGSHVCVLLAVGYHTLTFVLYCYILMSFTTHAQFTSVLNVL